jgi:hypothetical protein
MPAQVFVRSVSSGDGEALGEMLSRLSPLTIYERFHAPYPRVPAWALAGMVEADHHDREAMVAVVGGEIVGHAMYVRARHVRARGHRRRGRIRRRRGRRVAVQRRRQAPPGRAGHEGRVAGYKLLYRPGPRREPPCSGRFGRCVPRDALHDEGRRVPGSRAFANDARRGGRQ